MGCNAVLRGSLTDLVCVCARDERQVEAPEKVGSEVGARRLTQIGEDAGH